MTAVFHSFYWNACITRMTLSPPSYHQNLWLRVFAFISSNCRGHVLSYPVVVILLVDGRLYAPCPNNRGRKKKTSSRLPLVTSQSCVLFSAIISVCLAFYLWTHLGLCVMLTQHTVICVPDPFCKWYNRSSAVQCSLGVDGMQSEVWRELAQVIVRLLFACPWKAVANGEGFSLQEKASVTPNLVKGKEGCPLGGSGDPSGKEVDYETT